MRHWLLLPVLSLGFATGASALINPQFTPVDLAKASQDIWQLEMSAAKDGAASAKAGPVLKGKAPGTDTLTFDLSETDSEALADFKEATGSGGAPALLFTGDFSGAALSGEVAGDKPAAMLQVGTQWFALFKRGEKWGVGADPIDLNAVWSGAASSLAECVRYVIADPRADVPTTAGTRFTADERLGNIPGKVGRIDVIGDGKVIIRSSEGDRQWELFPKRAETVLTTSGGEARTELIADYDADGVMDKIIAKPAGPQFLRGQSVDRTVDTAELDYHSRSKPPLAGLADCDVNRDGRPDVMLTYAKGLGPLVFFNRGFGCFGLARELALEEDSLKGVAALMEGQQAAAFVDANGDGSPDLIAVAPNGDLWVLTTTADHKPGPSVTLTSSTPVTVTAREGPRRLGARQLVPGIPVTLHLRNPGPLDLEWTGEDGSARKRRVIAVKSVAVDLGAP
jgi:hypothetical protein